MFRKDKSLVHNAFVLIDNVSTESKKQLDAFHIEAEGIITGPTKLCRIAFLLPDLKG